MVGSGKDRCIKYKKGDNFVAKLYIKHRTNFVTKYIIISNATYIVNIYFSIVKGKY